MDPSHNFNFHHVEDSISGVYHPTEMDGIRTTLNINEEHYLGNEGEIENG
jgi:hypothetical protein